MVNFFQLLGALGLLLITAGVLVEAERKRNLFFIAGGILLEIYSVSIQDIIFIALQLVFILAAAYEEWILYRKKENRPIQLFRIFFK